MIIEEPGKTLLVHISLIMDIYDFNKQRSS